MLSVEGMSSAELPVPLDAFQERFADLDHTFRQGRNGPRPALYGNYEQWKAFIRDAVEQDAPPSRELIVANRQLAAWEAHLNIGKVSSFPVSVGFSITDVCNARCNFCAYAPERVSEKMLTMERLEHSDWLKFSKVFRPNAGLGEPLAHPQSADIFALLRRRAPFIDVASITNGSLLRPKVIEAITGYFTFLYVSVNAVTKESYEITMRPLKWDKLVQNLQALHDAKVKAATSLPRLDAGYVVHRHNLEELPRLPAFLRSFGFERLNVKPMVPPPSCSTSDNLLSPEDSIFNVPDTADRVFRELERECDLNQIRLMRPLPTLALLRSAGRPTY